MVGRFSCLLKERNAAPVIHEALKRLEYRGYDSVGEATIHECRLYVKKDQGKIDEVHALHNLDALLRRIGLSHIRWATHDAPLQVNAHPHVDCKKQVAVIQNGIIENYAQIKRELENLGHACMHGDEEIKALSDDYVEVVKGVPEFLCPIQRIVPLQLFAYYMVVERGLNPDRPKHLTKAVTVK